jgi:hypothetical protein
MILPIPFKAVLGVACLTVAVTHTFAEDHGSAMVTQWASEVSATEPHPEYPRPELVRTDWLNLNGSWDYTLKTIAGPDLGSCAGQILVPFPVESVLSGAHHRFQTRERLEYRRKFSVPASWRGKRVLLHFEAVNWEAQVELNKKPLGAHKGGYDRFTYDITDALVPGDEQKLVVSVTNPGDRSAQPRGKQSFTPSRIWYTSSTGIWQTVWLEPVPDISVASVELVPDVDQGTLGILLRCRGDANGVKVEVTAYDGEKEINHGSGLVGQSFKLPIAQAKLWSPEDPFLYDLKLKLIRDGKEIDKVTSYFGMRKISVGPGSAGLPRILLNNHPYFQLGALDQGFWPDGLYTAPTDEALRSDIIMMKRLGLNTCRKHVKVEPDRWYYWCDKLGLLVWQDMPSAGGYAARNEKEIVRQPEVARQFEEELDRMIQQHMNHPSIVMWIAFNEGWGQYDTARIVQHIKEMDPARLVIGSSGWKYQNVGDVQSLHGYPGPAMPSFQDQRAIVCGECGGLGLPIPDHTWASKQPWSYSRLSTKEDLQKSYSQLLSRIFLAEKAGLSGAVITQLTDVESEVNGLSTYDRAVIKVEPVSDNLKVAGNAPHEKPKTP